MPSCEKLKEFYNSELGKRIRFGIFVALNIGNVLSDWLLYGSVVGVKEGLVFGPPGNGVKYALLVFSILGSLAVVPEVQMDWEEIIKGREDKDPNDGCRGVIILVTDIPLMSINLLIVTCSEGATSYLQMGKSLVSVAATFIRLVHFSSKEKTRKELKGLFYKKKMIIVQFILACCLFIATQTESNDYGSHELKVPHNILKGEFDDRKYLTNVSIYFSHPYIDYVRNDPSNNIQFIKLLSIYDLKNSQKDITVNIKFDSNLTNIVIQTDGKLEQCFTKMNGKVIKKVVCSDQFPKPVGQFAFTFHFVRQSWPEFIFGDITYNMGFGNNISCKTPNFPVVDNKNDYIYKPRSAMMRYYRTWSSGDIIEAYHLIWNPDFPYNTFRFYEEEDLWNIEGVWVGNSWAYRYDICKSTGSRSPHLDEKLGVQCL